MEEPWTAITISVGNESHKAGPVPSIHDMWRVVQMKETACTPSATCASPLTVWPHMSRMSHHRLWIKTMITRSVFSLSDEAAFYISGWANGHKCHVLQKMTERWSECPVCHSTQGHCTFVVWGSHHQHQLLQYAMTKHSHLNYGRGTWCIPIGWSTIIVKCNQKNFGRNLPWKRWLQDLTVVSITEII